MSGCGVCIGGYDGDSDNLFESGTRVIKSASECDECGRVIPAGEPHEHARWRDDHKWTHAKTCVTCAEIAWAFSCGGRLYFSLWESMEDVFEKISIACFEKLKTPAAKAELQRRWMSWKGLDA